MNSPHQREQLPDLLCDALDAAARARVEAHLRQCPQCARELRQLQQMQATIASLPVAPVPSRVRENVRAALREEPRKFALPFAFPLQTRQLAWGGAAFVCALGLMLLARPSLQQDDAFSQSAPVSESEIAARSARNDAPDNAATAPDSPQKRARDAAKSNTSTAPAPQKVLPAPVAPAPVAPPPIANAQSDNSAPDTNLPSFAFPAAPQPIAPPKTKTPKSRPVAPSDLSAQPPVTVEPKPAPQSTKTKTAPTAKIARKSSPGPKSTAKTTELAPTTADGAASNQAKPPAPITAPSMAAEGSSDQNDLAFAPPAQAPMRARAVPAPLANDGEISQEPLLKRNGGFASSAAWSGGQIEATLAPRTATTRQDKARAEESRAGGRTNARQLAPPQNAPLVLTLSVAKPIGNARLILLAPNGESTIWRGELNELPVQIEISPATLDKLKAAKIRRLRARLEQIDGAGNPKSSSIFEIPLP